MLHFLAKDFDQAEFLFNVQLMLTPTEIKFFFFLPCICRAELFEGFISDV